ncbi:N-6 DNA methylase [Massilia varians]|uniref:N-6 DNA methylase n=1 Tax=Massilia varians TaxID=457921 RepID=UPI002554E0E4|nr:N-6 DNA methylase [Massilia varians]MDK6079778.1 N-6 DNA methylase [Massilia varians]
MKRDLDPSLARPSKADPLLAEHDRSANLSKQATDHRTNIIKMIDEVGRRHGRQTVFRDFVTMSAVALSKLDFRQAEEREELYMQTVRKYTSDEAKTIAHMFAELQEGLSVAPRDILGEIYMQLELGNSKIGQYFTPHHICELMAELSMSDNVVEQVEKQGFITFSEPASGSGATIIAAMMAMQNRGLNYQRHAHVTAVDLDSTSAMMAYVQLSLLHVPAVVVHGNTLTLEEYSHWYTPAHIMGNWNSKLAQVSAERAAAASLRAGAAQEPGDDQTPDETHGPSEAPSP